MKPLHLWNVSPKKAIQIQEALREQVILKKTFSKVRTVGGGDVAYAKDEGRLVGVVVVLSFPQLEILEVTTAAGKTSFPYIPGLLTFREGPILLKAFQKLKMKPDVMIFDGQGIAHPRGLGLASHIGLCLDLPSIGCAKTPLFGEFMTPGSGRGNFEWIRREQKEAGAVLRTKDGVKPLFVSPGHRLDLRTSIQIVLACCRGFRIPEPLRLAHQLAERHKNALSQSSQRSIAGTK
jgi:deoxyribonuclease V